MSEHSPDCDIYDWNPDGITKPCNCGAGSSLAAAAGYACGCGSTRFERQVPMRGFWFVTIDTASGEAVGVESTTDGLEEVRQPVRMRCIQCGKTHRNFRRHNNQGEPRA